LALDFSGDGTNPSVTLVDLEGDVTQVTEVPVTAGRRLIRLRGTLDQLPDLAAQHDNAWFFCEVQSDGVRLDVVREVRDRIPNALRVEQLNEGSPTQPPPTDDEPVAASLPDMYAQWLTTTGRTHHSDLLATFTDVVERTGER
jgi:exonuclease SbcD